MRKKQLLMTLAIGLMLGTTATGNNIPIIGTFESYAAVGDVVTSDVQEEIDGAVYPADGATITGTWKINNVYVNVYSDKTIVVSGTGSTQVMFDYSSSNLPPWKTTPVTTVLIKEGVTSIPAYSFYNQKSLVRVKLPTTFTDIRARVFSYCTALAKIEIPSNITSISSEAFTSSKEGMNVIAHCKPHLAASSYFPAKANITYTFEGFDVITSTSTLVGVYGDIANGETLEIPSTIDGQTITEINMLSNWSVNPLNVKSLKIPTDIKIKTLNTTSKLENLELQGDSSGNVSGIGSILSTDSVTSINLKLDENVTNISEQIVTTGKNYIRSIEAPKVQTIGNSAFTGFTKLETVDIPSIVSIGNNSFKDCTILDSVQLPSGIETIGNNAFQNTKIREVILPDSVVSIGEYSFAGNTEMQIVELGNITNVPNYAFSGNTKLSIPDLSKVTSIGTSAFQGCISPSDKLELSKVSIGANAFSNVAEIEEVLLDVGDSASINAGALANIPNMKTLRVTGDSNYKFDLVLSTAKSLEKVYILTGLNSSYAKASLPSTATVYCIAGSTVETWCKNNSVTYKTLTDEELEEIENGKRPTVVENSVMFDKQAPEDKTFNYSLGEGKLGARSIKSISINGNKVAFTKTADNFTLSKDMILTIPTGTHNIIVEFDNGYIVTNKLSITVVGTEVVLPPELTVPEQNVVMEKTSLTDISFKVYCESIDSIIINNKLLKQDQYTLVDGTNRLRIGGNINNPKTLTIKKEVFEGLKPNEYQIIIITEGVTIKDKLSVFITGDNEDGGNTEPPIILDTIKYEYYKDYPDYVVIPFSYNRADAISKIEIESNELTSDDYEVTKNTIVLDKDYISTLAVGKYRVSVTFSDGTVRSNIQLMVYEKAADRAAPYLLQSHIVFKGGPIVMSFDTGKGDLAATNVLAIVLDNELILPNGDKLPFTSSNVADLKQAYARAIEIDQPYVEEETKESLEETEEVSTPSNAIKDETEEETEEEAETSTEETEESVEETETSTEETEEAVEEAEKAVEEANTEVSETTKAELVSVSIMSNGSKLNVFSLEDDSNTDNKLSTKEKRIQKLVYAMADLEYQSDNVYQINGNEITLDGEYVKGLSLSVGDHLIGAIFDNTEKTTDVKKVILTVEKEDTPIVPDTPETPVIPEEPKEPEKPSSGGSGSGGSGSGGGSGSDGPGKETDKPTNPDGSLNPDYKPNVPDSGGNFEGEGEDWEYIKPDGSHAKDEWVGDGEDWYFIGEDSKLKYDWFADKETETKWYMLNREHNGKFGAAKFGWYHEKQDNQWYFLNPEGTEMLIGWQFIGSKWYYFTPVNGEQTYFGDNINGWKYDANKKDKPLGSMLSNTVTPDGYTVDENGALVK